MICEGAGTQFDPRLIEVFLSIADQFAALEAEGTGERDATSFSTSTVNPSDTAASRSIESGDTLTLTGDTVNFCDGQLDRLLCQVEGDLPSEDVSRPVLTSVPQNS